METLVIAVLALLVIAACNQLAPKLGVASPLILLALGVVIGFLPWVGSIEVDPEIILEAVLPPLLFATAVSMPVMDFRRELRSVSLLAVGLVLLSALVLGAVVHLLVPAISLPWAIALGAVLSPTDAVAVSIARGSGVNQRIITVLEGEGLFNDATALVLLSSAVAAALQTDADALQPAGLARDFLLALLVAIAIGWAVGELAVRVRGRITDPAADTVVSIAVPFLASIPAEHLGGSGLVAAVVAGLVTSYRGPRLLPPSNRRASGQNWRTIELVLEGGIFLAMGLQAWDIYHEVELEAHGLGIARGVVVALVAGGLTVVLRALFVAPLLAWLRSVRRHSIRRLATDAERIERAEDRLAHACDVDDQVLASRNLSQQDWDRALDRWRHRLDKGRRRQARASNDLAYFSSSTLGWREGTVIVWAGMRGAVTLAAAQTLPTGTPMRPFLLLVALIVAAGSLVLQGLSLPALIRIVHPQMASEREDADERERLIRLLTHAVKDTALTRAMQVRTAAGVAPGAGLNARIPSVAAAGRALVLGSAQGDGPRPMAEITAGPDQSADGGSGAGLDAGSGETAERTVPLPSAEPTAPAESAAPGGPAGPARAHDGVIEASETEAAAEAIEPLTKDQVRALAIEAIEAQRDALLDSRDEGVFSSQTLEFALDRLDTEQIMLGAPR